MLTPHQRAFRHTQATQEYSFNDASIRLRILTLLHPLLPSIHHDNLVFLVTHICKNLTRMRRYNRLGPRGIQSTEDVFIGVGHDGIECYMGLLVNAPGAGGVQCFLEGDRLEIKERYELGDEATEELRKRLVEKLKRVLDHIRGRT